MFAEIVPNARPLQTNSAHIVVWNFYDLLQAEHTWMGHTGKLIHRYLTQSTSKFHYNAEVKDVSNQASIRICDEILRYLKSHWEIKTKVKINLIIFFLKKVIAYNDKEKQKHEKN